MKKKTGKRIRYGSPAGAIFVLGVLILVVGGSFAAYTNFQSVKRVVSTGTQSDTMFGSRVIAKIETIQSHILMPLCCISMWLFDIKNGRKEYPFMRT